MHTSWTSATAWARLAPSRSWGHADWISTWVYLLPPILTQSQPQKDSGETSIGSSENLWPQWSPQYAVGLGQFLK